MGGRGAHHARVRRHPRLHLDHVDRGGAEGVGRKGGHQVVPTPRKVRLVVNVAVEEDLNK